MQPLDKDAHLRRLARLLDLEAGAEAEQARARLERLSPAEAERQGDCLTDLIVAEESSGLGGRCLLTLAKRNRTSPLPWTRLQVGCPVLLSSEGDPKNPGTRGVVCERTRQHLQVAVAEPPDDGDGKATYRVVLCGDEVARLRQRAALERAREAGRDRLAEL